MSDQIQSRRGSTAEHNAFTGALAEITVDTTKNTAVVHDGATVGGHPLAKETRSIATTEGIQGGGDLSTNRTLRLDLNGLTAEASPDGATDYVVIYDASVAAHRKVLINNLPSAGGAPTGAQYVVLALDGSLSAERVLAVESGVLSLTDGGANGNATLGVVAGGLTYAKLQNVSATDRLLGRATAGAGVVEEIACTSAGRALLDDADAAAQRTTLGLGALATLATVGASQIDDEAVTNAKLAHMAQSTLKGRAAGAGTGDATDLTAAQATAILDAFTDAAKGLAPASGGGTANFLRADGSWAVPPGTGGGLSDGDKGDITVSSGGTVWTIDNDVVTYAKMQNVSATDRLLGRVTAGAGDVEEITCTSAGRALLDDADAAAQRTTLGLGALATLSTVGTSQLDDDAVTYAKMQNVSATDRLLGRSTAGAGNVEEITCTSAGRALLDDADAAAQRTTLGLGALATLSTVGASQIDSDAVTTAKILAANVTNAKLSTLAKQTAIQVVIGNGADVITTGVKGYLQVPFPCTITAWHLVGNASGSIVIDVWRDTYANFPPVDADSIAGSELPTLSSAQKNQDTSLSTWTTTLNAEDWLAFNVDSATTVTQVTLVLSITRTDG